MLHGRTNFLPRRRRRGCGMTPTRAVVCAEDGKTRLEALELRPPGPGEIAIRMRASGLCGTDLWKLEHATAPSGSVLGHEVVGEVEALGEGAGGFRPGDRLVVPHHVPCGACALCRGGNETQCAAFRDQQLEPGGFSERILIHERAARLAARPVPAGISDEA